MEDAMKYFNIDKRVFDPWECVQKNAEGKAFLPLGVKKAWFRSKYPEGSIRYKVLDHTESYVKVEARVYPERNCAEDEYLGCAISFATPDMVYENRFLSEMERVLWMESLARGKAAARALTDAGFGLQFYLDENDPDENCLMPLPNGTAPVQQDAAPSPKEPIPDKKDVIEPKAAKVKKSKPAVAPATDVAPSPAAKDAPAPVPQKIEAEYTAMTLEEAAKVIVDCGKGFNKADPAASMTLGEIMEKTPNHSAYLLAHTKSEQVRAAILAYAREDQHLAIFLQSKSLL